MRTTTTKLLASAAIMALALGTASSAKAFDGVDWQWNKTVTSTEDINITVDNDFDWSGLVEIEKIQANIGNISAASSVSGIDNNAPGSLEGGTVEVPFNTVVTVSTDYNQDGGGINGAPDSGTVTGTNGVTGTVVDGQGHVDEGLNDIIGLQLALTGTVDVNLDGVTLDGVRDAIDLPSVVSAATAVANNQTIDSSSAINLHDAQYNFGGFGDIGEGNLSEIALIGLADQTDNAHTDAALGLTIAGALGLITQGSVTAASSVTDITNASVDSSATAVGNNLSVALDAATPGDATVIADLTQFNFANTSATSTVSDVDVNNYTNFGGAGFGNCGGCADVPDSVQTALVSSVATAVGNNVSIKVNGPSVE